MKRRIASMILALCMLAAMSALASCGAQSPSEVVIAAIEKTSKLDSYAADMKLDINMEMSGVTVNIPMNIEIMTDNLQSDKPNISAVMTMEMLGMSIEMNLYSDGEWMYIDALGNKYKTTVEDAAGEYDYAAYADSVLVTLPEELFADKELTKNNDGSQSITLEIPSETFSQIYGDLISEVNSASGEADIGDIEISDAVVIITVADGYVKTYDISFTMNMTVIGSETSADVKLVLTFKDPGTNVTVTAPEGLEDYTETAA